jgi:hypothetical protein
MEVWFNIIVLMPIDAVKRTTRSVCGVNMDDYIGQVRHVMKDRVRASLPTVCASRIERLAATAKLTSP